LFGFPVRLDVSWFVVAVLIAWSLATGLFPLRIPGLGTATYWAMGIVGMVALFGSVVLHEFSHALVARRYGIPMQGITLFIFGGVAEMNEEPSSAKAEFLMAVAGPIASLLIAAVCFLAASGAHARWPLAVAGVIAYLSFINALLAAFNLLPAFPLDGGRILRAGLWKWKGDLGWATRVATRAGSGFSLAFMVLGMLTLLFRGDIIDGLWWFLIGLFLKRAGTASYEQVRLQQAFQGEPVRRFMTDNPVTVPANISIRELVESYIYHYHFKLFPVAADGRLLGCITTREVKGVPRDQWSRCTVGSVAQPCGPENAIAPETDAIQALATMRRTGRARLMVVADGRLVGVVTLKDLLEFFALKVDLER
jgi:Zn-dependent protease/CBS domain-containing protein